MYIDDSTCLTDILENFHKNLMENIRQLLAHQQGDVIQSGGIKTVYYCYGDSSHSVADAQTPHLPVQFETDQALKIKTGLIEAGLIDDNWQAIGLSGPQRGLLAGTIAQELKIKNTWQVFGRLWNEKPDTLRKYHNRAFDQSKSLDFQDLLKTIMAH